MKKTNSNSRNVNIYWRHRIAVSLISSMMHHKTSVAVIILQFKSKQLLTEFHLGLFYKAQQLQVVGSWEVAQCKNLRLCSMKLIPSHATLVLQKTALKVIYPKNGHERNA